MIHNNNLLKYILFKKKNVKLLNLQYTINFISPTFFEKCGLKILNLQCKIDFYTSRLKKK